MDLRPRPLPLLLLLTSAGALLAALGFQYLGGYAPCHLCHEQRYAHVVSLILAAAALVLPARVFRIGTAVAALTLLGGAALAGYHVGVEQGWWAGPASCTTGSLDFSDISKLRAQIEATPVVRCDEVQWTLFGLSMAAWNFLLSAAVGLFVLGALVCRVKRGRP